jgi:hypothetical protein
MNPAMLPIVCASAGLAAAAKTMIRLSTRRVMCRSFAPAAPLCAPHDRQIIARITSDRHLNFELLFVRLIGLLSLGRSLSVLR